MSTYLNDSHLMMSCDLSNNNEISGNSKEDHPCVDDRTNIAYDDSMLIEQQQHISSVITSEATTSISNAIDDQFLPHNKDSLSSAYQTNRITAATDDTHLYRAIIALNNAGASLIQREQYFDGMRTLKDAIKLANSIERKSSLNSTSAESNASCATKVQEDINVDEMLENSCKRTSKRNTKSSTSSGSINIILISSQFDDIHSMVQFLEQQSDCITSETKICLTIDPIETIYLSSSKDSCQCNALDQIDEQFNDLFEIDCAILLYNYGIAQYAYLKEKQQRNHPDASSVPLSDSQLKACERLLQLSESLLCKFYDDIILDQMEEDNESDIRNDVQISPSIIDIGLFDCKILLLQLLLTWNILRMQPYRCKMGSCCDPKVSVTGSAVQSDLNAPCENTECIFYRKKMLYLLHMIGSGGHLYDEERTRTKSAASA